MANNYQESIDLSTKLFIDVVEPELKKYMSGTFLCLENIDNEVCKLLDRYAGIDYLYSYNGQLMGVANRIQISDKSWDTFTIRKSRDTGSLTEFSKREKAINEGYLYPKFTIQSYVSNNSKLIDFGIAKTDDIFKAIKIGLFKETHTKSNQIGGASFLVVNWQDMINNGFKVRTYKEKNK